MQDNVLRKDMAVVHLNVSRYIKIYVYGLRKPRTKPGQQRFLVKLNAEREFYTNP
jgi:hypothetical protein